MKNYITKMALLVVSASLMVSSSFTGEPDLDVWVHEMKPIMFRHLMDNVSPANTVPGVVIASPSRDYPNYYYHWIRDASLVMNSMVDYYARSGGKHEKGFFADKLFDFIQFSRRNQHTENPSGGLGEPKFNVDGTAFTGSWGRPQNDGPALRAITLIHLARVLIAENNIGLVREMLYDGKSESVIKMDLEYVSHHWRETCFDLWEETRGHHFYTQLVQRRALKEGSALAEVLGDHGAANWYAQQARQIEDEMQRYWDGNRRVIVETLDRDGGADYKYSNLDSGVILGVLHGSLNDGFFSIGDDKVLATVKALEKAFQDIYSINQKGYRGIAIGRYPEDRYDGISFSLRFEGGGNPWFLTTLAFAEFYYRLAREVEKSGGRIINSHNAWFFNDIGYSKNGDLGTMISALRGRGDDFLATAQFHMHDSHMSEQINRSTGFMQGARDLTWSYASFLTAVEAR